MTIHLIYPHQNKISAPHVIGHKLYHALKKKYEVKLYNFDELKTIYPQQGDILIGHPHPLPYTIFRNSIKQKGWRKKIILAPFNCDLNQVGFINSFIDDCDQYLAITGNYWIEHILNTKISSWHPKMRQIDLAVDRNAYPFLKNHFNPPGQRKFVYVGNDNPVKNLKYLSQLSQALREPIAWIGKGKKVSHLLAYGMKDFSIDENRQLIAEYDFMITVGSADANPTTILEAMSWGLIPICTPTSGYINYDGIINIPLNEPEIAINLLQDVQFKPEQELKHLQSQGQILLRQHFNWDRFTKQIEDEMMSDPIPLSSVSATLTLPFHFKSKLILFLKIIAKNTLYIFTNKYKVSK